MAATLAAAIAQDLAGRSAILDGEIVRPEPDGRPLFYELMRRRGPFCFYAFDLLWLDGSDLRQQPLLDRKRALRKLLPLKPRAVRYVEHVATARSCSARFASWTWRELWPSRRRVCIRRGGRAG
jgi:ATP-dependent DNA ligase